MIIDYEWNAGLVVGITSDTIYVMEEEGKTSEGDGECPVIYLHLGIISFCFIMNS